MSWIFLPSMSLTCTFSSFINVFILLCAGTHNSCFALFSYPGPRGFSWFFFAKDIKSKPRSARNCRFAACSWSLSCEEKSRKTSGTRVLFSSLTCICFVRDCVLTWWVAPPKMFCNWYRIARILGILQMNSCDWRRYIFFSNYYNSYNLLSVYFEVIYSVNLAGKNYTKFSPLSGAGSLSYGVVGRKNRYKESTSKAIVICLCTKLPPGWIDSFCGQNI